MDPLERFDRLVNAIYDASLQPARWGDALQAVADSLQCDMFHAFVWDSAEQRPTMAWASRHATSAMHRDYDRYYGRIDPRRRITDVEAPGEVFRCHERIDEREVRASEFYQDFLLPSGLRWMTGCTLVRTDRFETKIALLRAPGREPFSSDDAAWLRRLVPHLQRAARLIHDAQRLGERLAADESALGRLEVGVALLDEGGIVLHLNDAALALVDARTPLALLDGRLVPTAAHTARPWDDAWRRLRATGGPVELLLPGRARVHVLLGRVPPQWPLGEACGARWIAMLRPLARNRLPDAQQLRRLFDLTPAEARLACTIASGHTLAQAAAELGVKPSTVRSQLLGVLAKTGTHRQADLVALLGRIPPIGG